MDALPDPPVSGEDVPVSAPTHPRTPVSPPAARAARATWRDPRLALGVGLVAVCALAGARLIGSADDTVEVWSARTELVAGEALEARDFARARIHFASDEAADRYLSGDDPLPDGTVLTRDVSAGELLPRAAVGQPTDTDLVQLPVTVPTQALPASLRTGDAIDVWVTPQDGDEAIRVLVGVRVLALPAASTSLSPSAERQVIVGVDDDQQDVLPESLALLAKGTVVVTRKAGR